MKVAHLLHISFKLSRLSTYIRQRESRFVICQTRTPVRKTRFYTRVALRRAHAHAYARANRRRRDTYVRTCVVCRMRAVTAYSQGTYIEAQP